MEKARRILISFSGGKTSAYMTWCLLRKFQAVWSEKDRMFLGVDEKGQACEILVVFANTSKEKLETLDFVRDCDLNFGFHTIWIEGVFDTKRGIGTHFRVVDFDSCKRKGEVYENMIAVHGIPNQAYPHCTRELKTAPITKLVRSYGWRDKTYETFIGYRVDEPRRFADKKKRAAQKRKKHVYFLADEKPTTKLQINRWWGLQAFNLQLKDHEGNCNKCWKKSIAKLIAIEGDELNKGCSDNWYIQMEENTAIIHQNLVPIMQNRPIHFTVKIYREHKYEKKPKPTLSTLLATKPQWKFTHSPC